MGGRRLAVGVALCLLAALAAAAAVSAHIERAGYWPDPGADRSLEPPAGGGVPKARTLYTALKAKEPGRTHVVCQGDASLRRLRRSIRGARSTGWELRPSQGRRRLQRRGSTRLLRFNERLLARCRYDSIQRAVLAARNNDRIVIMPGVYLEPESRDRPTDDPECADLRQENDRGSGDAVSYAYQYECPNDQNLVAVMGRLPGGGEDPQPPRWDRHGIPNLGPCIRCNVQMEGSGVSPDDVVVEAGDVRARNGGPSAAGSKKDVGIRIDRADGFVLRHVTVRHAHEHNIYVLESDGFRLERFKTFYPGEYGVLTFAEDHGLIQSCEAKGAGDAGIYPGGAVDTGEQTIEPRRRYNQEVRFCDMHHNALGFSGTGANAVWVHHNDFYDNVLGLSTDVFTAAGHPGFPTDSILVEHNDFHSNNFNAYGEGSDVEPTVPVPVGVGLWIAGGNNHTIRNNRFWDNWRRGAMLFSVPDAFVCGPANGGNEQAGCDPAQISTSHRNRFHNNAMGRDRSGRRDPNGTDFWWDEFANNVSNCWYGNTGTDGTEASVTSEPEALPSDCAQSRGAGGPAQEAELVGCLLDFSAENETGLPKGRVCSWFSTPAEPKP